MRFAKWVFGIAGIYGLVIMLPLYFAKTQIGIADPPPITHPEYFYGFLGVTIAWQLAFLLIAWRPDLYRLFMLAGIAEKALYGAAAVTLFLQARISGPTFVFACIDMTFGALFVVAFALTGGRRVS